MTMTRLRAAAGVEAMPGWASSLSSPPEASSDVRVTTITSGASALTASAETDL
ncbi:hypothetical protein D3C85_1934160 [compost metagenome]